MVVCKINFGALALFVVVNVGNKIRPACGTPQAGFHRFKQTSLIVAVRYQRVVGLCYFYWTVHKSIFY